MVGRPVQALLMTGQPCGGVTAYRLLRGTTVVSQGTAGEQRPISGNSGYRHACVIDLGRGLPAGRYQLQAAGATAALRVGSAHDVFRPLLAHAVRFYQAQRDGAHVISSVLRRRPSHLNDRHAGVYAPPAYRNDVLSAPLRRVGGPVDVSGGWFDAGDFVKFSGTTAFTVGLLETALRDDPTAFASSTRHALAQEVRFGLAWLRKMDDQRHHVVYYQVGIGSGNATTLGDHDLWRLPQRDDAMRGHARRYLSHRPVFRAAAPGRPIAPSLAGRMSAAFALCAQLWPRTALGRTCWHRATSVLALARTRHVRAQVTASPRDYYPEDEWRDDLEWANTEVARAATVVPGASAHRRPYARAAARWAAAYRDHGADGGDTFTLYDVSALAHADLAALVPQGGGPGWALGRRGVLTDLRAQLVAAARRAAADPFAFGGYRWDPTPHALGLVVSALRYDALTRSQRFASLARSQLAWVLGRNAWGSSFVIGAGQTFPHCPQHVVANLVGSTDGTPPLLLGGTVDGPSTYIPGPGFFGNAVACPASGGNPFRAFDLGKWRYVDRVSSWATVEPALDYTALSLLAFADAAAG